MRRSWLLTGGLVLITGAVLFAFGFQEKVSDTDKEETKAAAISGRKATDASKKYWYDGTAEITSYKLSQARYGQMREGTAVLLYVTEPFSPSSNAKADMRRDDNVPVIKLNAMKNFNTGIYPYSLMTSTFYPFEGDNISQKVAFTMQEWCGTMYSEMRNQKGTLTFKLDSYFEGESFKGTQVETKYLEDDIWSLVRLNPDDLPEGEVQMVPSMSYLRMKHVPLKAYKANVRTAVNKDGTYTFSINYPSLNRDLAIRFETAFPHTIVRGEETYNEGGKSLTTKAERIKTIKSDYWNRSGNADAYLREELGLD